MPVPPVVRYMILCEDWTLESTASRRITTHGILTQIQPTEERAYPALLDQLCVVMLLAEVRGDSELQIECVREETGRPAFMTPKHALAFGNDPLDVVIVPFRLLDCTFRHPGYYSVQFRYNGTIVEERSLLVR
jgi:hypothetical protein